jgi:AraC-like DNA-binding protein
MGRDGGPLKMPLVEFKEPTLAATRDYAFDDWSSSLRSICGSFQPQRFNKSNKVTGAVQLREFAGIELAQIANNLEQVRREKSDIRADYGENLFLLIQLDGTCGVEQYGRQSMIEPGDCMLVDSSSPSVFHFGGNYSNHLSVHLPRQLLYSEKSTKLDISRHLESADPMSTMLRALVAKLVKTDARDTRAPHLRQLLFDTTRQAFAKDDEIGLPPLVESAGSRFEIIQILIDQNLTDENLTPRWLANRLGISMRTLQEDFSTMGTTASSLIRMRRLYLARDHLVHSKDGPIKPNIADVAYSTGFNDISYFNRCFRKTFACTPKDLLEN